MIDKLILGNFSLSKLQTYIYNPHSKSSKAEPLFLSPSLSPPLQFNGRKRKKRDTYSPRDAAILHTVKHSFIFFHLPLSGRHLHLLFPPFPRVVSLSKKLPLRLQPTSIHRRRESAHHLHNSSARRLSAAQVQQLLSILDASRSNERRRFMLHRLLLGLRRRAPLPPPPPVISPRPSPVAVVCLRVDCVSGLCSTPRFGFPFCLRRFRIAVGGGTGEFYLP